jgi:thioredoxin reductase (NADPH)
VGGQIVVTDWIDNYPGFPEGLNGYDLVGKMAAQAARFGLVTRTETVTGMDLSGPRKILQLADGRKIRCRALIIATGARPNSIDVPGEKELTGRGVSYCGTCDGPFFRDMDVAVVGGGNTAVQEAMYLTRFVRKVTLIHRRDQLRATRIYQEQAFANPKIEYIWDTVVTAVTGENEVQSLRLRNLRTNQEDTLAVAGVFVLIGTIPNNGMLPLDQLDSRDGFLVTDQEMCTNIAGVMAAGDIRHKKVRQVINACGEGAVAEQAAERYLEEMG